MAVIFSGKKKRRYLLSQGSVPSDAPYDHNVTEQYYTVTHDFYQALKKDSSISHSYDVKMVTKVTSLVDQQLSVLQRSSLAKELKKRIDLENSLQYTALFA